MQGSSRPERTAGKPRGGLARHLEGWQPGVLAVFVAGMAAALAVPRPVAPVDIPEPFLDPIALERVAREDRALADAAERTPLDTDVRALGSALRAYNLAEVSGDPGALALERRNVAEAAALAVAQGEAAVTRLRAYQLRSFLREVRRWEETGEETDELRELGGTFISGAQKSGWIEGRHLLPDATVRAVRFKKRWMELGMVHGRALDVTPPESIALYRFLLRSPPLEGDAPNKAAELRRVYQAEHYRLKKIDELHTLDPAYPVDLGRGVVLYRLHSYPMAVEAFRRHLEAHPDGPYTLRAQNYLRAALGSAMEAP